MAQPVRVMYMLTLLTFLFDTMARLCVGTAAYYSLREGAIGVKSAPICISIMLALALNWVSMAALGAYGHDVTLIETLTPKEQSNWMGDIRTRRR